MWNMLHLTKHTKKHNFKVIHKIKKEGKREGARALVELYLCTCLRTVLTTISWSTMLWHIKDTIIGPQSLGILACPFMHAHSWVGNRKCASISPWCCPIGYLLHLTLQLKYKDKDKNILYSVWWILYNGGKNKITSIANIVIHSLISLSFRFKDDWFYICKPSSKYIS